MLLMIHDKQTGELHEVVDLGDFDLVDWRYSPLARSMIARKIREKMAEIERKRIC
jgi:hypothetical protein